MKKICFARKKVLLSLVCLAAKGEYKAGFVEIVGFMHLVRARSPVGQSSCNQLGFLIKPSAWNQWFLQTQPCITLLQLDKLKRARLFSGEVNFISCHHREKVFKKIFMSPPVGGNISHVAYGGSVRDSHHGRQTSMSSLYVAHGGSVRDSHRGRWPKQREWFCLPANGGSDTDSHRGRSKSTCCPRGESVTLPP